MVFQEDMLVFQVNPFLMFLIVITLQESFQIAREEIKNTLSLHIKFHMTTIVWDHHAASVTLLSVIHTLIKQMILVVMKEQYLIGIP